MNPTLYYIHDPMCSWCWGFSNTLEELLGSLPKHIKVKRLLGGLAADSDVPMPVSMQLQIKSNWQRIEDTIPGVKFNFDFWEKTIPRRSTYPACRAVIAARMQGEKYDISMIKAIQRAYYLEARNPSDDNTLIELASEMGLEVDVFKREYFSDNTQKVLENEILHSRELFAESFPSLVFEIESSFYSIKLNYTLYNEMLKQIEGYIKNH